MIIQFKQVDHYEPQPHNNGYQIGIVARPVFEDYKLLHYSEVLNGGDTIVLDKVEYTVSRITHHLNTTDDNKAFLEEKLVEALPMKEYWPKMNEEEEKQFTAKAESMMNELRSEANKKIVIPGAQSNVVNFPGQK